MFKESNLIHHMFYNFKSLILIFIYWIALHFLWSLEGVLSFPSVDGITLNDIFFFAALILSVTVIAIGLSLILTFLTVTLANLIKIKAAFIVHLLFLSMFIPVTLFYFLRWLKGIFKIKIAISDNPFIFIIISLTILCGFIFFIIRKKPYDVFLNLSGYMNKFFSYFCLPIIVMSILLLIIKSATYILEHNTFFGNQVFSKRHSSEKLPNVILIVIDSLSAKHMSLYGYTRKTTPHIDEFSKKAFVFRNMHANATFTNISIASLLTGKYPIKTKVFSYYAMPDLNKRKENILAVLRDKGYKVYAITSSQNASNNAIGNLNPYLSNYEIRLWMRFFERTWFKLGIDRSPFFHDIYRFIKFAKGKRVDEPDEPSNTAERAFKHVFSIVSKNEGPFFIYVHIFEPHLKTLVPLEYRSIFCKNEEYYSPAINQKYLDKYYSPDRKVDVEQLRNVYDEMILYVDNEFGKLVDQMRKADMLAKSLIILTADHGYGFFNSYVGSSEALDESITNVPLIIKVPFQENEVVLDVPVQHSDIVPTILSILGFDVPDWVDGKNVFIRTYTDPMICHNLPESLINRDEFTYTTQKRYHRDPTKFRSYALWLGKDKYIYRFNEQKVYKANINGFSENLISLDYHEEEFRMVVRTINKYLESGRSFN